MTLTFSCRGIACLLPLLMATTLHAAEEVELQWKFKKGHVYKYVMKHKEVRTVEIGSQKFETTTATEYDLQWTVQEIDDKGIATLEQKVTGLRVTSNSQGFDFEYNSARANNSDDDYKKKLINFYDQLRFATYQVRLKPDGRVAGVQGLDKVLGEVTAGTQIADYHGFNLHDDSFAWYLQQLLGTLPAKAVAAGGKWKEPIQAKLTDLGEVSGQTEFTLQDKPVLVGERLCQEFCSTSTQKLELETKWLNNPLKGTLKAGKLTGTVRFDAKAGAVRESKLEAEMSGELKLGPGDKPAVLKVTLQHALELEAKP